MKTRLNLFLLLTGTFVTVLLLLPAGELSPLFAGPCYTVGNSGPAHKCHWSFFGSRGPCPTGLQLPDTIYSCGTRCVDVLVPRGTRGNQPVGLSKQEKGSWTCKQCMQCTKKVGTVGPLWPPVAQVYCAPGKWQVAGSAKLFGPAGTPCRAGG